MSHRLLILGGGIYQRPLVDCARRLGCTVFATSYLPNDPALAVADRAFDVSILDPEGLERLCRAEHVTGVLTAASDLGSLAVGRLNDRFGWRGLTEAQARAVSDKRAFVGLLQDHGLPCPPSFPVETTAEREAALSKVDTYPVVMKPRFASGSRGVRVCHSAAEVREKHETVLSLSRLDRGYVLQRFLHGVEHGAECLIEGGRVVFLQLTHKYHTNRSVPLGHCVPFECPPSVLASVRQQVQTIAAALKVEDSAVNIDLILTPEGVPNVIDFSFRLGGNLLPHLMHHAFGVDTYERVVRHCIGADPGGEPAKRGADGCYGAIIFGADREGVLKAELVDAQRELFESWTRVIDMAFDIAPGERYRAFEESSCRFGHALFRVNDLAAYERVLEAHLDVLREHAPA